MFAESLSQTICLHLGRIYSPGRTLQPAKSGQGRRLSDTATRQLREYIYHHLCDRITLAELSKLAGMTTHHLLIAFRKAFGQTPAQYIIQQRLRCAQRQLADTKKDITTIALDSGFSSHSHLTACFSKHLGYSPSAFRLTTRTFA